MSLDGIEYAEMSPDEPPGPAAMLLATMNERQHPWDGPNLLFGFHWHDDHLHPFAMVPMVNMVDGESISLEQMIQLVPQDPPFNEPVMAIGYVREGWLGSRDDDDQHIPVGDMPNDQEARTCIVAVAGGGRSTAFMTRSDQMVTVVTDDDDLVSGTDVFEQLTQLLTLINQGRS